MTTARRSWPRSKHLPALSLILVLLASVPGAAHRRDEYLQATRIAIEPDRVDIFLDLTPGIAVAERVLAEVDRDRSGSISAGESGGYARMLLSALELEVDGSALSIEPVESSASTVEAMRGGEGAIRVTASARLPPLGAGRHHLRYRNNFRPDLGVYLANALVPASGRIAVTAQRRDVDQRELTIEYTVGGATETRVWTLAVGISSAFMFIALLWSARRLGRATTSKEMLISDC
jgi:hypothetical protein